MHPGCGVRAWLGKGAGGCPLDNGIQLAAMQARQGELQRHAVRDEGRCLQQQQEAISLFNRWVKAGFRPKLTLDLRPGGMLSPSCVGLRQLQ